MGFHFQTPKREGKVGQRNRSEQLPFFLPRQGKIREHDKGLLFSQLISSAELWLVLSNSGWKCTITEDPLDYVLPQCRAEKTKGDEG